MFEFRKTPLVIALWLCSIQLTFAQEHYKIRTIAFYNLENLFDTRNDSLIFDDDRTPDGKDQWTPERFHKKIENLSLVIREIGNKNNLQPPDLLGVCEVENRSVLDSLRSHPLLARFRYQIVHYDSPDERGIDVALLYRKDRFYPTHSQSRRLLLYYPEGERNYTRDQLVVSGIFDNEPIHIVVNHWPSRSGGQTRSAPYRKKAAELTRAIVDSIAGIDPHPKIVVMGDFNDDPTDKSIQILEGSGRYQGDPIDILFFNPLIKKFHQGSGSLAYRDEWSLFDQILLSPAWMDKNDPGYQFWKANIFNAPFLQDPHGRYKGYPLRTYAGGTYQGGFSDHYPVYALFIKVVTP